MKNKTQKLILFLLLQLQQLIITFGSNIDIPQNLIKEKRWKDVDAIKTKAQKKSEKRNNADCRIKKKENQASRRETIR